MTGLVSLWIEALEESCPRCESDDVYSHPVDDFPATYQRCYECGHEWHRFVQGSTRAASAHPKSATRMA